MYYSGYGVRYIFPVAFGIFIFKKYKLKLAISVLMTVFGAAFISVVSYGGYKTRIINASWASTGMFASMMIAPVMALILQKKKLKFLPAEVLGQASYHIFLVQLVYYTGYYKLLENIISGTSLLLIIGIVICTGAGVIFYYLDKPVQAVIGRKLVSLSRTELKC